MNILNNFHLTSLLMYMRRAKSIVSFTIISYTIGLVLPTLVLASLYYEYTDAKRSFMIDSERIIQVENDLASMAIDDHSFDPAWGEQLQQLDPAIESVSYKSETSAIISVGEYYLTSHIVYVDQLYHTQFRAFISEGHWFQSSSGDECIIGSQLSNILWKNAGEHKQIRVNGDICEIIGTTDVLDRRIVMMHDQKKHLKGHTLYYVKVKDADKLDDIALKISEIGAHLQVNKLEHLNKEYLQGMYINFGLMLLLTLTVFVYALLNIGNVIGFILEERKGRYGIQLALGCSKRGLYTEFFLELFFITTLSIGVVISLLFVFEALIERYLIPIRLNGFFIPFVMGANAIFCALLCVTFMKGIFKHTMISLIRGNQ